MSNLQRAIDSLPDNALFKCYDEGVPTQNTITAQELKTKLDPESMALSHQVGNNGYRHVVVYRVCTGRLLYREQ